MLTMHLLKKRAQGRQCGWPLGSAAEERLVAGASFSRLIA